MPPVPSRIAMGVDADDTQARAKRFGNRLRVLRKAAGLTQPALAKAVGVTQTHISDIENGKRNAGFELIEGLAQQLGLTSAGAFWSEDEDDAPSPHGERHTGITREYLLDHVIDHAHPYHVRGILGVLDAKGPAAGLAKALKYAHLHRSGKPDYKTVELTGVPQGVTPIDLRVPLEVRASGEVILRYPAGMVLLADRERAPVDGDLVVAAWDPDPDPTGQDLSRSEGKSELRRYVSGPHGVALLFELGADRAVTLEQGWRIAATIIDVRTPRPA